MSSEVEIETTPGLPHELPSGERVLWQGRPEWKGLARQAFKVGWLTGYFALFAGARLIVALESRQGAAGALGFLFVSLLAVACLGLLSLFAWLYARSSVYTITNRRVVLRIGVALPMTWNLPFARLASADLKVRPSGDGDIVLRLKAPDRVAWLQLWPHTAPGHFVKARPSLRAIAEPVRVAALLADAVRAWGTTEKAVVTVMAPEAWTAASSVAQEQAHAGLGASATTEAGH